MKGSRTLSKKKYYELSNELTSRLGDAELVTKVLNTIKEVLDFDPEVSTYDEVQAKKIKEYRQRKKEEGISTYITSGVKSAYYKKKQKEST